MQALCVATLGTATSALRSDNIRFDRFSDITRFYLQYFFPPSSVGETGRGSGGPGLHEITFVHEEPLFVVQC